MWERGGQKIREAARAHRGPPLADQGHPRRGQRIALSLVHRLMMELRDAFASRHRNAGGIRQTPRLASGARGSDHGHGQALDATWARSRAGMAVGLQRPRPLVECRGQPHEQRLSRRLLRPPRSAVPHWTAPPSQSCLTNRRIRVRTYGVGGGSREASSRPIPWLRVTARDHSFKRHCGTPGSYVASVIIRQDMGPVL